MGNDELKGVDILPHREPFLFLDRLVAYSPKGSVGLVTFVVGCWFFPGHFPRYSIVPGVILLEAMCQSAAAFDLSAACSGFVYGLEMVKSYLLCHPGHKALVVGTEVLSRQIDWADRTNAMLFGDGAAAVLLEMRK